jgi:DNA invertase Pin-like site-specific DNA recombinase
MASGQRLVAYERVSTARQGASGLGLEAQRKVIEDFASSRGAEVLARFTEVESGRKADRPELAKAVHLAKVTGAKLVIAKLDRLSRNAASLLALRDSGVRFVAVDMPDANDLTVGTWRWLRKLSEKRSRGGRRRRWRSRRRVGWSWGTRMGPRASGGPEKGGVTLRAAVKSNAAAFAADLAPVLDDIRKSGKVSLRAIAADWHNVE